MAGRELFGAFIVLSEICRLSLAMTNPDSLNLNAALSATPNGSLVHQGWCSGSIARHLS